MIEENFWDLRRSPGRSFRNRQLWKPWLPGSIGLVDDLLLTRILASYDCLSVLKDLAETEGRAHDANIREIKLHSQGRTVKIWGPVQNQLYMYQTTIKYFALPIVLLQFFFKEFIFYHHKSI